MHRATSVSSSSNASIDTITASFESTSYCNTPYLIYYFLLLGVGLHSCGQLDSKNLGTLCLGSNKPRTRICWESASSTLYANRILPLPLSARSSSVGSGDASERHLLRWRCIHPFFFLFLLIGEEGLDASLLRRLVHALPEVCTHLRAARDRARRHKVRQSESECGESRARRTLRYLRYCTYRCTVAHSTRSP